LLSYFCIGLENYSYNENQQHRISQKKLKTKTYGNIIFLYNLFVARYDIKSSDIPKMPIFRTQINFTKNFKKIGRKICATRFFDIIRRPLNRICQEFKNT